MFVHWEAKRAFFLPGNIGIAGGGYFQSLDFKAEFYFEKYFTSDYNEID